MFEVCSVCSRADRWKWTCVQTCVLCVHTCACMLERNNHFVCVCEGG